MDDTNNTATPAADRLFDGEIDGCDEEEDDDDEEECCDVEAWETLRNSLKEVQSVLDQNRRLIQQVNDNHRSKIPYNLTRNVELIGEINSNISSVLSLYSNLSSNFSTIVRQRREPAADKAVKKVQS